MPFIVSTQPQYALLQWSADRLAIPGGMWSHDSRAVGVFDKETGEIRACMVMNGFSGNGCEVAFTSDGSKRWLNSAVVRDLISMPFSTFNMRRVIAYVAASDTDTQIAALRIGFKFEARVREGMADLGEAILFSMMPHEMPKEISDGL
jgi:RimJ/RimL family protein N-acetyltransferase